MIAGGFAFGLFADRRPFGETFFGQPIVVFAALAGLGLLLLRVVLRRPVPEVISERAMVVEFFSRHCRVPRRQLGRCAFHRWALMHVTQMRRC